MMWIRANRVYLLWVGVAVLFVAGTYRAVTRDWIQLLICVGLEVMVLGQIATIRRLRRAG
jgi:hypothetical protein